MTTKLAPLSPQEMADLAVLAQRIAHSDRPGVREHFALLVNTVDPQMAKGAFPDVVMKRQMDALRAEFKAERDQEKMNRVVEANEAQKREVLKKYGHTEETAKKLDEIRTQYGLSDWNAAALIYAGSNPPENPALKPPPQMLDGSGWDFPTVPGPDGQMLKFGDYIKNPRRFSNQTAINMIQDFKRGALPSAFQGGA